MLAAEHQDVVVADIISNLAGRDRQLLPRRVDLLVMDRPGCARPLNAISFGRQAMEVDSFDAVLALIFVVITIAVVVRGIRRGDPSRKIRMNAFFPGLGIATGVRGFFPNNLRVGAVYALVLLVMAAAALWKGPRSLGR